MNPYNCSEYVDGNIVEVGKMRTQMPTFASGIHYFTSLCNILNIQSPYF